MSRYRESPITLIIIVSSKTDLTFGQLFKRYSGCMAGEELTDSAGLDSFRGGRCTNFGLGQLVFQRDSAADPKSEHAVVAIYRSVIGECLQVVDNDETECCEVLKVGKHE